MKKFSLVLALGAAVCGTNTAFAMDPSYNGYEDYNPYEQTKQPTAQPTKAKKKEVAFIPEPFNLEGTHSLSLEQLGFLHENSQLPITTGFLKLTAPKAFQDTLAYLQTSIGFCSKIFDYLDVRFKRETDDKVKFIYTKSSSEIMPTLDMPLKAQEVVLKKVEHLNLSKTEFLTLGQLTDISKNGGIQTTTGYYEIDSTPDFLDTLSYLKTPIHRHQRFSETQNFKYLSDCFKHEEGNILRFFYSPEESEIEVENPCACEPDELPTLNISFKMQEVVLKKKEEMIALETVLHSNVHNMITSHEDPMINLEEHYLTKNNKNAPPMQPWWENEQILVNLPYTLTQTQFCEYFNENDGRIEVVTNCNAEAHYQLETNRFSVTPGEKIEIHYDLFVEEGGKMALGLLNSSRLGWYGEEVVLGTGRYANVFERAIPAEETETSLVLRNYHLGEPGQTRFIINALTIKRSK